MRRLRGVLGRSGPVDRALALENGALRAEAAALRAENDALRAALAARDERIDGLVSLGDNLRAQLAELQALLGINSRNSSKPPSSDGPEVPKRRGRSKSGRKRGGQLGHHGTSRPLAPPEAVSEFVALKPATCARCGHDLVGEDPHPLRHQVVDIPKPELVIVEYVRHRLVCPACGATTWGQLPEGVGMSPFGPRVHGLVGILVGRFRQSKRGIQDLLQLVYSLDVSLGAISKMERRLAVALAEPVEEVRTAIRTADVVHQDETGWRQAKNRAWLWVAATELLVTFSIDRRRGSEVAKRMLGEDFAGVVCTDRWTAYTWVKWRALCWAHIQRDFAAMAERHSSPWHGDRLANLAHELLAVSARWRAGAIDRATMEAEAAPLRARTEHLLAWTAANAPGQKARATARNLLQQQDAMWRWLTDERVPPTNNLAERLLRYAVIWRKLSYGTDSLAGSLYVERLLSAVGTLHLQRRDAFEYLTQAVIAHSAGQPAPSLLPLPSKG